MCLNAEVRRKTLCIVTLFAAKKMAIKHLLVNDNISIVCLTD